MTFLQAAPFLIAFMSAATALISVAAAHFAADHSKRNGIAPESAPEFFVFSKNSMILGVVPSFRMIYSDGHRIYGSRFITRCIQTSRVGFAIAVILLVFGLVAAAL